MTEVKAETNGSVPQTSTGKTPTPRRLRQNFPALPSSPGASEMGDVAFNCKVDSSPTNWESVPLYSAFSLSSDGSFPKVKVTRSKYCDLRSGNSQPAGSGRCYRVIF
jgi:hypothetical protein